MRQRGLLLAVLRSLRARSRVGAAGAGPIRVGRSWNFLAQALNYLGWRLDHPPGGQQLQTAEDVHPSNKVSSAAVQSDAAFALHGTQQVGCWSGGHHKKRRRRHLNRVELVDGSLLT